MPFSCPLAGAGAARSLLGQGRQGRGRRAGGWGERGGRGPPLATTRDRAPSGWAPPPLPTRGLTGGQGRPSSLPQRQRPARHLERRRCSTPAPAAWPCHGLPSGRAGSPPSLRPPPCHGGKWHAARWGQRPEFFRALVSPPPPAASPPLSTPRFQAACGPTRCPPCLTGRAGATAAASPPSSPNRMCPLFLPSRPPLASLVCRARRWYMVNADVVWGPSKPSLLDTKNHAKWCVAGRGPHCPT